MGESIVVGIGNDCDVLLMRSTHSAYPQVISRRFASFRVRKSGVFAVKDDFWGGFDSRQPH
jgi:hypothetical protein